MKPSLDPIKAYTHQNGVTLYFPDGRQSGFSLKPGSAPRRRPPTPSRSGSYSPHLPIWRGTVTPSSVGNSVLAASFYLPATGGTAKLS